MVSILCRHRGFTRAIIALTLSLLFALSSALSAFANVTLTRLSTDPYTNGTSQHATEVEPDTYSFGSTIVSAFQVGRFNNGGASNIGFATSTDGGTSWTSGFLPGTTTFATPPGTYDRLSDASVAYDPKDNVWLISYLGLVGANPSVSPTSPAVLVSRSADGGLTWDSPIKVNSSGGTNNQDKNWTVCDVTSTSPFYGHCYTEWDDNGNGNLVQMSTSTDGGLTWGTRKSTANNATVIGGQPLVQPSGTVVVPIENANETSLLAFTSINGGASWNSTITVTSVSHHTDAGSIRSGSLPTAEIDGAGKVYVVWSDCRFESRCRANDLVMTTSTNGTSWTAVTRIPADAVGSGVDHFIPGLAVDKSTMGGNSAHLGLAYYYYPATSCSSSTCKLDVGFVSSTNGGSTWSTKTQLAGPMTLTWLANTTQGHMVGDYISTSFANGTAHPVFMVANPNVGSTFDEAAYSPSSGLSIRGGSHSSKGDAVVASPAAAPQNLHRYN